MGIETKISWCDATFNPWIGCQKVSDGCKHCYAESLMDKRYGRVKWGPTGTRQRTSVSNWRKPLQWNKQAKVEGRRYRVFCASLADVFEDNEQLVEWRQDLLDLIINTPHLDWLLLTKRPENVCEFIEQATGFSDACMWFPRNVWLGTSVENQETADKRIPELLRIPAKVRFLSCEPLLGPIDLSGRTVEGVWIDQKYADADPELGGIVGREGWPISWVIVGGESGHKARPMHPDWAKSLRDQCQAAGVAFHFKQWGEWLPPYATLAAGVGYEAEWIAGVKSHLRTDVWFAENEDPAPVWKVGKHVAGRLLDGRTWDEFPA